MAAFPYTDVEAMPTSARTAQFTELLQRFFALGPWDFFASVPPFSDFDGPNVAEVAQMLAFVRTTYEVPMASGDLSQLSYTAITQLHGHLQNTFNTYDQLLKTRDQGSYQGFAVQLDTFAHHTRMFAVPYLAAGGAQIEAVRTSLQTELDRARANNAEVEKLAAEVHTLITPAVAGSLSQQFMSRRDTLVRGRFVWLTVCLVLGALATGATYSLVDRIMDILKAAEVAASAAPVAPWAVVVLRTIVLIPVFAAVGFAFAQYRKERDFEEEYAHKAAVAHSLPNYGDLARETAVRDQIVTAATAVIFTSPTDQARSVQQSNAMLGGMKEVVDVLSKAVGRR